MPTLIRIYPFDPDGYYDSKYRLRKTFPLFVHHCCVYKTLRDQREQRELIRWGRGPRAVPHIISPYLTVLSSNPSWIGVDRCILTMLVSLEQAVGLFRFWTLFSITKARTGTPGVVLDSDKKVPGEPPKIRTEKQIQM